MYRIATLSLCLVAALLVGALAGCDDSPTSVEDFEIQPDVSVSRTSITFIAGQTPAPTFTTQYQGLDSHPTVEGSGGLSLEKVEETGTPQNGSQTWAVRFEGSIEGSAAQETVTLRASSGGREITEAVSVQVNNPVSIVEDFASTLAVVTDYEGDGRMVTTSGGTAVDTVRGADAVAENSNGLSALRVNDSGSGAVTFERRTNAPGADVFSFLLRSEDAFTLTVTLTDEAGGEAQAFDVEVPVEGGGMWRKYSVAAGQLFDGFDPAAARSGGDGPLLSVSLSASDAVTYVVDELFLGTTDGGPAVEINDFEETNLAYGPPFCPPTFENTGAVADMSDGFTAQRISGDGGCFGYNFQTESGGPALFLDAPSGGTLTLIIGQVEAAFNLNVFIETPDGAFGNGVVLPIEEGEAFREITVPFSDLGGNPATLRSAGITNVGFDASLSEDSEADGLGFTIDDIKLRAGT